jgi:hypothetical protein
MRGRYLIISMILHLHKAAVIFFNFFMKFISLNYKYNLHKKQPYIKSNNDEEIVD